MHASAPACAPAFALTKATILGTLCMKLKLSYVELFTQPGMIIKYSNLVGEVFEPTNLFAYIQKTFRGHSNNM